MFAFQTEIDQDALDELDDDIVLDNDANYELVANTVNDDIDVISSGGYGSNSKENVTDAVAGNDEPGRAVDDSVVEPIDNEDTYNGDDEAELNENDPVNMVEDAEEATEQTVMMNELNLDDDADDENTEENTVKDDDGELTDNEENEAPDLMDEEETHSQNAESINLDNDVVISECANKLELLEIEAELSDVASNEVKLV